MGYNFGDFIEEVKDLDLPEIRRIADQKCQQLENLSWGIKGAVERRAQGSAALVEKVKGLLFWLNTGIKPAGLTDDEFILLEKVCIKLIEKGQMSPEALGAF